MEIEGFRLGYPAGFGNKVAVAIFDLDLDGIVWGESICIIDFDGKFFCVQVVVFRGFCFFCIAAAECFAVGKAEGDLSLGIRLTDAGPSGRVSEDTAVFGKEGDFGIDQFDGCVKGIGFFDDDIKLGRVIDDLQDLGLIGPAG